MPDDTMDLWPDELATAERQSPVAILRTQAALLGRKTNSLIVARVVTQPVLAALTSRDTGAKQFVYTFQLVAPALGGYTYDLFSIAHGINMYPVELRFHAAEGQPFLAVSEEEFIGHVRLVLSAPETKRVIGALLAQSQE